MKGLKRYQKIIAIVASLAMLAAAIPATLLISSADSEDHTITFVKNDSGSNDIGFRLAWDDNGDDIEDSDYFSEPSTFDYSYNDNGTKYHKVLMFKIEGGDIHKLDFDAGISLNIVGGSTLATYSSDDLNSRLNDNGTPDDDNDDYILLTFDLTSLLGYQTADYQIQYSCLVDKTAEVNYQYTYTGSRELSGTYQQDKYFDVYQPASILINDNLVYDYRETESNPNNYFESGTNRQITGVNYTCHESDSTVTIKFIADFFTEYTSIIINGTEYINDVSSPFSSVFSTEQDKINAYLDHIEGQNLVMEFTVNKANTYNIVTTEKDCTEAHIGNFLWFFDDSHKDSDDYFGNGNIEIEKIEYDFNGNGTIDDGESWTSDENDNAIGQMNYDKSLSMNWDYGNRDGSEAGEAVLPTGAKVTVILIPDYGYQLTHFSSNGFDIDPQENIGEYTFEIQPGNFHLGAMFEKVEDVVDSTSKNVTDGSIEIGDNEIDKGSAVLSVSDADESSITDFENSGALAANQSVDYVLDLELNQVIYKGQNDSSECWVESMGKDDELNQDAVISLDIGKGLNNPTIVHEKHDGTYEVLDSSYDSDTGIIKFTTNSFSKYAVATGGSKKLVKNAKTGDYTNTAVMIALLMLSVGAAVILIRRRNQY